MQPAKEDTGIEEFKMASKTNEQPMDLNVVPLPEELIESLVTEHAIVSEVAKEDQIIEVLHIDFIFGNRPLLL